MKLFFSIFNKLTKIEKIKFYWITFFIIILLFLELISLSLLLPIIKIIFSSDKVTILGDNFFFNDLKFQNQIYFLLSSLVFLYFIKNLFNAFIIYYKKRFLSDIQINFSSRVFSYYLNQPYNFFLTNNKPQILRNLGILQEYIIVVENFINIAIEIFILALILIIIFYNDIFVGLFLTIFAFFFIIVFLKIFKDRFKRYGELINQYNEKLLNNYLDTLGSIKDIILQKKQNFFIRDFSSNISVQAAVNVKNGFFVEAPRLIIEIMLVLGVSSLIILLTMVNQDLSEITVTLTFTIALILRAIPSITRIIYQSSGLFFKIDTIKRVQTLLSTLKFEKNFYTKKEIDFKKIILKNINFTYADQNKTEIFKNLDLSINKNETIGIIGSSGSGKSTLLDIICCILSPNTGGIYLDDKLIDKDLIHSWQDKISYISQKNYLLNESLSQNIAFAEDEKDINIERIYEAIRFSKLESLVKSHKEGINFQIGEDGKNISGGQRQRIILARSIYRKADVIIFDEATSALDKNNENEILDDIKENFHGKKTLFISTHKETTLSFCDRIINVDNLG